MNLENLKTIIIYLLIAVSIIINNLFQMPILNIGIWIIITIIAFTFNYQTKKVRGQSDKQKVMIIIIAFYYIIYLLLGLEVGYKNSPYSLKIIEIIKNVINVVLIQIMYEYVRGKAINKNETIINYIVVTIVFILLKLDYSIISTIINAEVLIKYALQEFLPVIIESALLTYLFLNGGYYLNIVYIAINSIATILIPIFPDINWFIDVALKYVMYLLIFLFVSYEDVVRTRKKPRRNIRKQNPIKTFPYIVIMLIIVSFVAGILPYKPIAVISNSMKPSFSRGDICIIKKVTDYKQITQIQKGDIIEYYLNNIYIVHRVVEVQNKDDKISFITKGDNNMVEDLLPVSEEQVVGIVVYTIPYLGYPSVWFSEFLARNNV